jgi:hypothetical protein
MPRAEKYFIGPSLLGDIRRVVERVDAAPYRVNGAAQDVRLQEMHRRPPARGGFRICTFTGAWAIGTEKTVTFRGVTTTPNTVTVTNLFASVSGECGTRDCAIARDGDWYLVAVQCE